MSCDLFVSHRCESENDVKKIVKDNTLNISTRISLLAQTIKKDDLKNYARTGDRREGGGYKSLVYNENSKQTPYAKHLIAKEKMSLEKLSIWQPNPPSDFSILVPFSTFLQFEFTLATSFISRDDEVFHINENPIRKDKVFKVPMMAASSWKGNLRWMATHLMVLRWYEHKDVEVFAENRFRLALLFGDEAGEADNNKLSYYLDKLDSKAAEIYRKKVRNYFEIKKKQPLPNHAGRLYFYPTFFDQIGLEVINPHDRNTKAGKQPIHIECVPKDAKGIFSLLYIPLQKITRKDAKEDLILIANSIKEMMITYGFSAKKTVGFGTAEIETAGGNIVLNHPEPNESKTKPSIPLEPAIIQHFKEDYMDEDFSLKPRQWREKHGASKKKQERYKQVKEENRKYQDELKAYQTKLQEWEEAVHKPTSPITKIEFTNWEDLNSKVQGILAEN